MTQPSVTTYRDSLREANLYQRELLARMRAACLAQQLGDRGMDWIEPVIEAAGLWPHIDGDQTPQEIYDKEMAEQARQRSKWAAEE